MPQARRRGGSPILLASILMAVALAGCGGHSSPPSPPYVAPPSTSAAPPIPANQTIAIPGGAAGGTLSAATPVAHDGAYPTMAFDAKRGRIVLVYLAPSPGGHYNTLFTASSDGGVTWDRPVQVNPSSVPSHGWDMRPRIAADPTGVLYATWGSNEAGAQNIATYGSDGRMEVQFASSHDGGRTWSAPQMLQDSQAHSIDYADLAVASDGTVFVATEVWQTTHSSARTDSDSGMEAFVSHDGGKTWTVGSVAPLSCPCCNVNLLLDGSGSGLWGAWRDIHVVSSAPADEVRDIVVGSSSDGVHWHAPIKVHDDEYHTTSCPNTGPSLGRGADGVFHLAWWTGATGRTGYWEATSTDGKAWSDPQPLQANAPAGWVRLAVDRGNRTWFAWEDKASSRTALAVQEPRGQVQSLGYLGKTGADPIFLATAQGLVVVYTDGVSGLEARSTYANVNATALLAAGPLVADRFANTVVGGRHEPNSRQADLSQAVLFGNNQQGAADGMVYTLPNGTPGQWYHIAYTLSSDPSADPTCGAVGCALNLKLFFEDQNRLQPGYPHDRDVTQWYPTFPYAGTAGSAWGIIPDHAAFVGIDFSFSRGATANFTFETGPGVAPPGSTPRPYANFGDGPTGQTTFAAWATDNPACAAGPAAFTTVPGSQAVSYFALPVKPSTVGLPYNVSFEQTGVVQHLTFLDAGGKVLQDFATPPTKAFQPFNVQGTVPAGAATAGFWSCGTATEVAVYRAGSAA